MRLPAGLHAAVLDRLGLHADPDLADLVEAVTTRVLAGSTAKHDAVAAGEVPPGADPVAVAERWLAEPGTGWSCWATCTLLAALAEGCDHRASVVATRRVDPAAKPVDFHSLVVVDDGRRRWVCDPYFGVGLVPADTGGTVARPGVRADVRPAAHGWAVEVRTVQWPVCGYRTLTGPLEPGDVEAFCRVSMTHTGVGPSRYVLRLLDDGVTMARQAPDGPPVLRRWRVAAGEIECVGPEEAVQPSFDAAVAALLAP